MMLLSIGNQSLPRFLTLPFPYSFLASAPPLAKIVVDMNTTDASVLPHPETEAHHEDGATEGETYPLPLDDYKRYGRQMILDGFGLRGAFAEPHIRSPLLTLTCGSVSMFGRGQVK